MQLLPSACALAERAYVTRRPQKNWKDSEESQRYLALCRQTQRHLLGECWQTFRSEAFQRLVRGEVDWWMSECI